ncbi:MAG TPA: ABC transporter permease [Anaerolineae bacterium]|nr:ABC transporter permease [Anaerolineae bacterium]
MRNTLLVIKYEARNTLNKRSFWLMTFLLPALIIALSFGSQALAQNVLEDSIESFVPTGDEPPIGYVDMAGLIAQLPPQFPPQLIRKFPDEAAAQAALQAGTLKQYYVLPADYLETGHVVLVDSQFTPFTTFTGVSLFEYIINLNLAGDAEVARALADPITAVNSRGLAPDAQGGDSALQFFVPFGVMFVFFFVLTMSSGFMLQSVAKEKENRTVEVLLLSVRPRELMLGKVVGLGLVALLQMAVWLGVGYLALSRGAPLLNAESSFQLPPNLIAWAVPYFLLGYLLYASALGALGALAPNTREGTQFTFILMLPLMVPLWLSNALIQAPNGALALFLSLFPLTAPTSMLTRMVSGDVPTEQLLLGLFGLAVTTYLFVLLAARFFRADTLLATGSLNWRRVLQEIRR